MRNYQVISADSHVVEPQEMWGQRIEKRFRDRAAFDSFVLRPGHVNDRNSYKVRQGKVGSFRDYVKDDVLMFLNRKVCTELSKFYGYM
jgi:hypothetical protein